MQSTSSSQKITLGRKIDEAIRQFLMLAASRAPWKERDFSFLQQQFDEYNEVCEEFVEKPLENCSAFEVGTGQRPYRFLMLQSQGVDVQGVDLDISVIKPNLADWLQIIKENGVERAFKTAARYFMFDLIENRKLARYLSSKNKEVSPLAIDRISTGDATSPQVWPNRKFDFIYSEDVLEHIPTTNVKSLCALVADHLAEGGIFAVRPMIFTGIKGGHNVEWYDSVDNRTRQCPPWDHLRSNLYPPNTYLNKMRLPEYRTIFSDYFITLREENRELEVGKQFLTDDLRSELAQYSDEEIYANHVLFVLKARN